MYYLQTCAVTCGALRHAISVNAVSVLLHEFGTLSAFVDKHSMIYVCVFIQWVSDHPEVILVGIK